MIAAVSKQASGLSGAILAPVSAPTPPPPPDEAPERETSPVELLWDLVFVFAVT